MKLLLVEDEQLLSDSMARALRGENYLVEQAFTFDEAWEKMGLFEYDCILLDIMLPGGSGLSLLQELKQAGRMGGVLIISAKDSIDDKVMGLNLGADDYLAKPFHLSEMTARVNSIIRRRSNGGGNHVVVGNTVIALDKSLAMVSGKALELSRKEYDILLYFAQRKGHVIGKESLAEAVWGDYIDQVDNFDFIYTHMKNLRRKLSAAGSSVEIKAIYGFGYKLIEE